MSLDVEAVTITGRWFKHASVAPRTSLPRPYPPPDNRWQRGTHIDAIYLAEHPETAWAEWYRHLAEASLPPSQALPRDLWTWEVEARVADLAGAQQLGRVGLTVPTPGRRRWQAYQAVGEQLADDGWAGLVTLSAARPDYRVLCLFRNARGDVPGARPVHPPLRVVEAPPPPTGMTT